MINWAFQESSYLAIRRSIFLVSFFLLIIQIYDVAIPVPFTDSGTGNSDKIFPEKIDPFWSSTFLTVYLVYLLMRSVVHSEKYLDDQVRDLKEQSNLSEPIDKGSELIDSLKGDGNNPLRHLLPSDEELNTTFEKLEEKLETTLRGANSESLQEQAAQFKDGMERLELILARYEEIKKENPDLKIAVLERTNLKNELRANIEWANNRDNFEIYSYFHELSQDHGRLSARKTIVEGMVRDFENRVSGEKRAGSGNLHSWDKWNFCLTLA